MEHRLFSAQTIWLVQVSQYVIKDMFYEVQIIYLFCTWLQDLIRLTKDLILGMGSLTSGVILGVNSCCSVNISNAVVIFHMIGDFSDILRINSESPMRKLY
jgi:hypothetical protein